MGRQSVIHETTALKGIDTGIELGPLIAIRPKTFAAMDAVFEAYIHPHASEAALSRLDRGLCAYTAARLISHTGLAEVYLAEIHAAGGQEEKHDELQNIMLDYVGKMVSDPETLTEQHIRNLMAAGLNRAQIIEMCQVVAFVTYQARVLHGLRMWKGETL